MKTTLIKNKFGYIFLALILAFACFFGAQALTIPAKAESIGIFTISPSAKAENGKLTFRVWVDKEILSEYMSIVPLTHTYFNVVVNGTVDNSLGHYAEGINYTNWEYNLSDEQNVGFGYFDVIINVADKITTPIAIVFGYTNVAEQNVDVFSDTVTYASVYNSPADIEELKMQISFLEKELGKVSAESYANYERYSNAQKELERLKTEYNTLQNEEKIKAWGVLISAAIISLALLSFAIVGIVKMAKTSAHWVAKLVVSILILAILTILGLFVLPEILPIITPLFN